MKFPAPVGPELEKITLNATWFGKLSKLVRAGNERNMNNEKAGHVLFILNKVNVITVVTHT